MVSFSWRPPLKRPSTLKRWALHSSLNIDSAVCIHCVFHNLQMSHVLLPCISISLWLLSWYITMSNPLRKAFIKTAENIYGKIKEGVYDPSREGNGVKLGSMASTASKATAGKSGGCCWSQLNPLAGITLHGRQNTLLLYLIWQVWTNDAEFAHHIDFSRSAESLPLITTIDLRSPEASNSNHVQNLQITCDVSLSFLLVHHRSERVSSRYIL